MQVIYGGTFDPVHHGHLRTALEVREHLDVDRVALVPCHIPPHRALPGVTSEQRLALLELAVRDEPGLRVDDRELRRGGASYTADTLRQLRETMDPGEPLVMVVGTDAFAGFDRWRDWQQIPELAHIVLVQRAGETLQPGSEPGRLLQARRASSVAPLKAAPAGCILPLALPLLEISATGIRERVASGRSVRYLLPDAVVDEIFRAGLYRGQSPS